MVGLLENITVLEHRYFVHTWDLFPCRQYNIFKVVETETALFDTKFV